MDDSEIWVDFFFKDLVSVRYLKSYSSDLTNLSFSSWKLNGKLSTSLRVGRLSRIRNMFWIAFYIEVDKQISSMLLFRPITLYVSELCSFCHLGLLLTDIQFLYSCMWLLEVCWRYIQRFLTFSHPMYKQIGQQCLLLLLLTSYSLERKLPLQSSAALQIGKGWGEICCKFQIYFVKDLKHDESNVAPISRSQWSISVRLHNFGSFWGT